MRVLCAVELTEPRSFTRAVEDLVERLDAELYVLHVIPPAPSAVISPIDPMTGLSGFAPYTVYDPQLEANIEKAETDAGHLFFSERFTRPIRPAVRKGAPGRIILEDADAHDVDLVVVGIRHHSRLERLILGSVARTVVENASRPTLVVPILPSDRDDT